MNPPGGRHAPLCLSPSTLSPHLPRATAWDRPPRRPQHSPALPASHLALTLPACALPLWASNVGPETSAQPAAHNVVGFAVTSEPASCLHPCDCAAPPAAGHPPLRPTIQTRGAQPAQTQRANSWRPTRRHASFEMDAGFRVVPSTCACPHPWISARSAARWCVPVAHLTCNHFLVHTLPRKWILCHLICCSTRTPITQLLHVRGRSVLSLGLK